MQKELSPLEAELQAMRQAAGVREAQVIETIAKMNEMLLEVEQQRNQPLNSHDELRSVNEFAARVMETMSEILILLGPNGRIRSVNRKCTELLGYLQEEAVGLYPEFILGSADAERLTVELGEYDGPIASPLYLLVSRRKLFETEAELVAKSGETVSHILRGAVLFGASGKREGAVIIGTDIRHIKKLTRYLEEEMQVAMRIQTAILPEVPERRDMKIAALMLPCTEVAGDYYDVLEGPDGCLWFGIGDVTGHGVTPGLVMMMAQSAFSTTVSHAPDMSPRDAVLAINRLLYRNVRLRLKNDEHMTLSVLKYEGDGQILHAGLHLDMLVYRQRSGRCERLPTDGVFVGIVPDISHAIRNERFALDVGDVLVLLTDGIIEARGHDKRLLDYAPLETLIVTLASASVAEIRDAIVAKALTWCNNAPDDDISLVVIRRTI